MQGVAQRQLNSLGLLLVIHTNSLAHMGVALQWALWARKTIGMGYYMGSLHYENHAGMLVRRDGYLHWYCPWCHAKGQSKKVLNRCPECGQ